MNLVKVVCAFCGKNFFRSNGRHNEAQKFGWKQYCSLDCISADRRKRQIFSCENCGKKFERTFHAISLHNYCSQSCAALVNNKRYPRERLKPIFKTCVRCKKQFKKSTGNKKYCSMECRCYAPEELLKIIKTTFKNLGRTPARRELFGGINKACIKSFGSWNNAVLAAGFTPNRSHDDRMYKRARAKALDGHSCDSISELLVDNWLYKNGVLHERDVYYPETHYKADWTILNGNQKIFIEYFGLANDSPRYDRAIKEKIKLCQRNKIFLIPIYSRDLYPKNFLEINLKEKFRNLIDV